MTNLAFRHEIPAAAQVRAGGTGVAFTRSVISVGSPVRRVRERGFTLLEALIVLAIIGLITAIVMVPVNSYWQRARLATTAGDIRSFMQQVYVEAVNQHTQITVSLRQVSGAWVLQIAPPPLHSPATYTIPDFVQIVTASTNWPTVAGVRELSCDSKGLTLDPSTGPPNPHVGTTQTLAITHARMVDGSLTPNTRWDIQVYPLWNVNIVKVLV